MPDYYVDHTDVEAFWKADEGENFNWMIYVFSDRGSANRAKDRYSREEDVDSTVESFEIEHQEDQLRAMRGLAEFKLYAKLHKRDMKFGVYNLVSSSANMQAVEEWGGSLLEPQVVYLDGLHPVNGKFKRFFRNKLFTIQEFRNFRQDIESGRGKPFFFSEEPKFDQETGKMIFLEDEKWPGWLKLTGRSYKPFMRSVEGDVVMFYMNNEDYRSKNMFEIIEEALKPLKEDKGYRFQLALIDSEKNEIENYKYARTPYLSVIRKVGDKRKEYKAVWLDHSAAIERFLRKNLSRIEGSDSDL